MTEEEERQLEVRVWALFRAVAGRATPAHLVDGTCFHLEGFGEPPRMADELGLHRAPNARTAVADRPLRQALRQVFHELLGMGLVVPSKPTEGMEWTPGSFSFTARGLRYFRDGVHLDAPEPSPLIARLKELKAKHPKVVGDEQLALLAEAQHCWRERCYRAAMVLTGLAAEATALALVDALAAYPAHPPSGGPNAAAWSAIAPGGAFSKRWSGAVEVLRALKKALRSAGQGLQPWWSTLEPAPEWLLPLGEAIRLARNEAAHNPDRVYGSGDVTVLLAALPAQLETIAELTALVSNPTPPAGVSAWPTL